MPTLPPNKRRPWQPKPEPRPYVRHAARTADYDSKEWKELRKKALALYPICCVDGCSKPSKVADHSKSVRLGGNFWDINNLQGMCWSHHQRKSASERTKTAFPAP